MVAILALCLMEVGGCASIQEREVAKTIQEDPNPNALAPNIPSISQSKTEPERIRQIYEIKARRVEPVGIVYLWPQSG